MDINHVGMQMAIVFGVIVLLWLFLKTLKIIWKLALIICVFCALSFLLPAIRDWILSFFHF